MATTTNYGWTTPDDTALVKDGAAAIRTLGSSVDTTTKNLNPETTLGDLAYRSSTANVNTRLALGTSLQQLRVNSGATAPEWFTPAVAASGMTLITRNAFSAVSTLTIDTLFSDTYENYVMSLSFSGSNGGEDLYMRGRYSTTTHTGSTYNNAFGGVSSGDATTVVGLVTNDGDKFNINIIEQSSDVPSINNFNFFRSSGNKQLVFSGTVFNNRQERGYGGGGVIKSAQTWTGLHFYTSAGTITGTFTMYGLAKA